MQALDAYMQGCVCVPVYSGVCTIDAQTVQIYMLRLYRHVFSYINAYM